MRKYIYLLSAIIPLFFSFTEAHARADSITIEIVRRFSKDIFESNGVPFLKPMVQSINATSNSRFFNSAFVPKSVSKPYFKLSVNGMMGFVPKDYKTYKPSLPLKDFNMNDLGQFVSLNPLTGEFKVKDTVGLAYYAFHTVVTNAIKKKYVTLPESSTTILGDEKANIYLPREALMKSLEENPAYPLLPATLKDSLIKYLTQFPEEFQLPAGLDMTKFFAAIPQIEIGSLFGTEALVRFIPPIDMGKNIGKFAFWGLGLKHSISQYFTDYSRNADYSIDEYDSLRSLGETPLDMAAQLVYQGTSLVNKVGVTNAELDATATMVDFNLQFSKKLNKYFELYGGYSLETIFINAHYLYYIPWDLQIKLGLVTPKLDENGKPIIDPETGWNVYEKRPPEFPGDEYPQSSNVKVNDINHKLIFGVNFNYDKFNVFLDFNLSKFSIFTGGVSYRF